jgi:hypothetical protein
MIMIMIITDSGGGGGGGGGNDADDNDMGHWTTNMKLSNKEKIKHDIFQGILRSEVLMAVKMLMLFCWVVMPCGLLGR